MPTIAKSGNNILCNGTAGTISLANIVTAINDTTWIEDMGSGVYRIKCTVFRYLYIQENIKLSVASGETLEIYTSIAGLTEYFRLVTYAPTSLTNTGGIFEMLGASIFNGLTADSAANTYNILWYISGGLNIQGSSGARVLVKYLRNIQIPFASSGVNHARYFKDDIIVQYADFDYHRIATQLFVFGYQIRSGNVFLDNIRLYNTPALVSPIFITMVGYFTNCLISNITIGDSPATTALRWTFANSVSFGIFKDITIEASKWRGNTYNLYATSLLQIQAIQNLYVTNALIKETNQNYAMFDTVVFGDQTYGYYGYLSNNSIWVLKDCTFTGTVRQFILYNDAKLLLWNTAFLGVGAVGDNGGAIASVFGLDLTVQDINSNPINDAIVLVKQKDNYERYYFKTNASGKLDDLYGYNVCLCVNRMKTTSNDVYWSDTSNSTYHTVTVLKEGYKSETFNVVMNQDRTQTVQLRSLTKMYIGTTEITGTN